MEFKTAIAKLVAANSNEQEESKRVQITDGHLQILTDVLANLVYTCIRQARIITRDEVRTTLREFGNQNCSGGKKPALQKGFSFHVTTELNYFRAQLQIFKVTHSCYHCRLSIPIFPSYV